MDTTNNVPTEPSTGATPAVPAGRPDKYASYSTRAVVPTVLAPRPDAMPAAVAAPAPVAPPPADPVVPAAPAPEPVASEPIAEPAQVTEPAVEPVAESVVPSPDAQPDIQVIQPDQAAQPEQSEPAQAAVPEESVVAEEPAAPAEDYAVPVSINMPPAEVTPDLAETSSAPALPVENASEAAPTQDAPSLAEPVQTVEAESTQSAEVPVQVAVAPAPTAEAPAPVIQLPPSPVEAPAAPAQLSPRPSFTPGATIDDFRAPAPAAPAPVAQSEPAAPIESAAPVVDNMLASSTIAPLPPTTPPAGPGFSDVIAPPAQQSPQVPQASPVDTPAAPVVADQAVAPAQPEEAAADADLSQVHLGNQFAPQAKKQRIRFAFLRHHPKAVVASLAIIAVLGGGSGFYVMHTGATSDPKVVSTWIAFQDKSVPFTAKFVKGPKHSKLNSGDAYVESSPMGDYGVRVLSNSTQPNTVIAADAANYDNGKVVKQSYKTVSGNSAVSGTITGSSSGQNTLMTFQFLVTDNALYEIYTVGYGGQPAPNTEYFFTTFKPLD